MEQTFNVNKEGYYKGILMVYNFNLNLSDMELDVVSTLLSNDIKTVDAGARATIRKILNKDKYSTNNCIGKLKRKGMLLETADKRIYINPSITNLVKDSKISFEFIRNDSDN